MDQRYRSLHDSTQTPHPAAFPAYRNTLHSSRDAGHVFGSYARGGFEPGDVDVAIDIDRHEREWRSHFISGMSCGRDPYAALRMALRGRTRSIEILFERHTGHDDVPMTIVWRRGETPAFERIDGITPDPSAGRAARDATLCPPLKGLSIGFRDTCARS